MNWVFTVIVLIVIGFILDREIYFYEGAHLGPRIQSWLYDRWSRKYDAGKRESQLRDNEMLAQPLLEKLKDVPEPFILDFATGTGRLSFALLSQPEFNGRIIALDISQGMLEQAAAKLSRAERSEQLGGRSRSAAPAVELLRHQSMPLPFPDAVFDAVCCLEVLELLPDAQAALNEMSRLLRPGGILLTSRGTEESGRKAKIKSKEELASLLEASGFQNIQITNWWKLFDRVLANKIGVSNPVGARKLSALMRCSVCGQTQWQNEVGVLKCGYCGNRLSVIKDGIVLN